jgi:hypothetical protein
MTTAALPTLSDEAVRALRAIVGDDGVIVDRAGIDEFRDPYWIQFDVNDTERVQAAFDVSEGMVQELGEMGYGESRAHLDFMDLASDQHRFNDHAYRRFVTRIKDAIDPNGGLSPGRHGIWPSHRCEEPASTS